MTAARNDAPISSEVAYLPDTGDNGEMAIGVGVRRFVQLDICPTDPADGIIELNAAEAIRLGKALIRAGKDLARKS